MEWRARGCICSSVDAKYRLHMLNELTLSTHYGCAWGTWLPKLRMCNTLGPSRWPKAKSRLMRKRGAFL